ncbi:pyridoxamine 5'-phosphate oxidase family protein [Aliiroseovarius sediminis]|uniref:pyridoxamine 5'-phosphate oxidase family protein n=1 Tax=Aliiroseovarius sediminis TaxID=2925839 RepID=UPI001F59D4D6|nr:pyridoxamine 5'-phosphate oxidase family protein [Aliiroseovarius sediminis]MCI2394048.1 pyridoxamine 5'-phosphate oxidase family protein [Aliiroseovarius sediminis]
MSNQQQEFWDRLEKVRTGLMGLHGRHLPMTHYPHQDENAVYFLTADGTDAHDCAVKNEQIHYLVSSDKEGLYADVTGKLSVEADQDKLEEVWNAMAAAWFEDGKTDPSVRLLKLQPQSAEVWIATDSSAAFLIEMAKAGMTGNTPDVGSHEVLTF